MDLSTAAAVSRDEEEVGNPEKYLFPSSSPPRINASGSSNVMSKKVTATRLVVEEGGEEGGSDGKGAIFGTDSWKSCWAAREKPVVVYCRRRKRLPHSGKELSYKGNRLVELDSGGSGILQEVKEAVVDVDRYDDADRLGSVEGVGGSRKRSRSMLKKELLGLGGISDYAAGFAPRLREREGPVGTYDSGTKKRKSSSKLKRWIEVCRLSYEGVDPIAFVGLSCKVYWPDDFSWYTGSVSNYNSVAQKHQVDYEDGDSESLILSKERIKFHISFEEVQQMNMKFAASDDYNELLALAMSFNDSDELEPGDIVWAKVSGYPMWPAVVINEAHVGAVRALKANNSDKTLSVQFFGTHDFARINIKQAKPFASGLLSSFHLKCKQNNFVRSLDEAKMYLREHQLPITMTELQKGKGSGDKKRTESDDEESIDSMDESLSDEWLQRTDENITCPFELGSLCVISLGKIVCDSNFFHNKKHIWPEGYKASRKFISTTNTKVTATYMMEVLRNPRSKTHPLFRVTTEDGEQIEGPNPTFCWKTVYNRIRRHIFNGCSTAVESKLQKSGSCMFGFSNPKIGRLIQNLPNSRLCSKYFGKDSNLPAGYRAVHLEWKDIDRCDVCHMDEEYEDNLFLQCDRCCMTVHARCYGELEPLDGVLWLCNLCRSGAPSSPPPCSLCPVIGGAMKPTTDDRWAHLTCAIWIPETCLVDIKRMEPIDGLNRISKDRWKLLCSLCGVSYGACIQCSNSNCYVAYHPLCARAAGLCVEPEDEDRRHLMSDDEDKNQCIRLLSFCKKHMPQSKECSPAAEQPPETTQNCSTYVPPSNPSGSARSEPYNFFGRRGQKEPQVIAAASMKRLYVENVPHLIRGCQKNGISCVLRCNEPTQSISFSGALKLNTPQLPPSISSIGDKYEHMKAAYKKRLAFGKSRVHGFGVFAKVAHKTGDMVIEYTGEVVRPPIADIREHLIYNSLVGAGTYMFHIDNERVIDATRAGSIAHLINHSCDPNCYSRMVSVHGEEHIIIFARRDINQWEELTYDYRFLSKDEQLACYCGFPKCRGVVNDAEALEQLTQQSVPRSELIPWRGE